MVWPPRQLMERTLRREGWLDMPREGAIYFQRSGRQLDVVNVEGEKLDPSYRALRD
jgi:hypothetical protein